MSATSNLPELFPGHRYWKSMQGSVDAILTPMGISRRVVSRGTQFVNYDAWTGEAFAQHLCEQLSRRPKQIPSGNSLTELIGRANRIDCRDPHIRVAKMPQWVTHRTALAIVGGGYHEAWHTKYSKRDKVRIDEVQPLLDVAEQVVLGGGEFDAKMRGLLITLHHLIEDIRIERRGNEDFPGAEQPMRDLQDFILDLESKGRTQGAKVKNVTVSSNARSILLCCFRDLGLGYSTQKSRAMIQFYKDTAPGAVSLLAPGGLLAPLLYEAKNLPREDGMGSLRIAMQLVVELWRATQNEEAGDEQPEMVCPQCGAGPKQLIIRSVKNEQGVKVKGRAELECRACGFKHEFDLPDNSLNLNQQEQQEQQEKPDVEDLDQDDVGNGADGFGDDSRQHMQDKINEGGEPASPTSDEDPPDSGTEDMTSGQEAPPNDSSDSSESSESSDSESSDSESSDSESSESSDSESSESSDSESSDSESSDSESNDSEPSDSEPSESDSSDSSDWEMDGEDFQNLGGNHDLGPDADSFMFTSQEVLEGDEKDGLINHQGALEEAFGEVAENEKKDTQRGEMLWNPIDLSRDVARVVESRHKEFDTQKANQMLAEVRPTVTYLRARLRTILKAQEMTDVTHGVRRGRRLSQRTFVDTVVDLEAGRVPSRAYQIQGDQLDTSFAVGICLDQSSSMEEVGVREVAKTMMVMTDSIEGVGGKTMAFGFRDGAQNPDFGPYTHSSNGFHRVHGIRYDIFKTWEEKFSNVKWRFAHTHADGWTPMADGIQYGLTALNERREAHRILAVITDGDPTPPHDRVIRRQLRLAQAAGVHIIGIGIGPDATYVKTLFPDYVWAENIAGMPQPLLKKLNELCDFTGRFRGHRVRLDGNTAKRMS